MRSRDVLLSTALPFTLQLDVAIASVQPLQCTPDIAFVAQRRPTKLMRVNTSSSPFVWTEEGSASSDPFVEYNALSWRTTDNFLYAMKLTLGGSNGGAEGLVRIGAGNAVESLNIQDPNDLLPVGSNGFQYPRYDGGTIGPDGSTFYLHLGAQKSTGCSGNPSICADALWLIDMSPVDNDPPNDPIVLSRQPLRAPNGSALDNSNQGRVNDLAFNLEDERLYGADATHGQVTIITPNAGVLVDGTTFASREDVDIIDGTITSGTPHVPGNAYGGAWFGPQGHLFVMKNGDGEASIEAEIYEIDVTDPTQPVLITGDFDDDGVDEDVRPAEDSLGYNDATSCISVPPPPCPPDLAFAMRNRNEIYVFDPSSQPFSHSGPTSNVTLDGDPIEINGMAWRPNDNLLYAVQLSTNGNIGLVRFSDNGLAESLGTPNDWRWGGNGQNYSRFDGGAISMDGSEFYVHLGAPISSGNCETNNPSVCSDKLYIFNLTALDANSGALDFTVVDIMGPNNATPPNGRVNDLAVNPNDGMLYGANAKIGGLTKIDPSTGVRTDVNLDGIPPEATTDPEQAFGGVWFGSDGHLYLYRNVGHVYRTIVNTSNFASSEVVGEIFNTTIVDTVGDATATFCI